MMEGKTPILLSSSLPRSIIGIRRSLRSLRLALYAVRSSHRRRLFLQHHGHSSILLEARTVSSNHPLSQKHIISCLFFKYLLMFIRKYHCLMIRFCMSSMHTAALTPTLSFSSTSSDGSLPPPHTPQTPSVGLTAPPPVLARRGRSCSVRSGSTFLEVPQPRMRNRSSSSSSSTPSLREAIDELAGFRKALRHVG